MHEFFDDIVPHPDGVDPDHDLIHERAYVVRAYRKDAKTLWLRGAVRDQKPPGLYVPGDTEPLTVHHMIVDLHIAIPSLEIIWANAALETHPHGNCPKIEDHYQNLVGLSIARGFTHKVRELFGGPRGCTHTTALLQAMAPVAVQSIWSFRVVAARESGEALDGEVCIGESDELGGDSADAVDDERDGRRLTLQRYRLLAQNLRSITQEPLTGTPIKH